MKLNRAFILAVFTALASAQHHYDWDRFVEHHGAPVVAKDYDNRVYFAVQLHSHVDPEWFDSKYADSHEWRYEQPMGTLKDHYLFSMGKDCPHIDILHGINDQSPAYHEHKLRRDGVSLERRERIDIHQRALKQDGLRMLQLLPPKVLEKRLVIPRNPNPDDETLPQTPAEDVYLPIAEAREKLGIRDPLFDRQWHLINSVQIGHDINVTGVWAQGITGKDVSVAVIDDGLDMDHPDLKDNYFAPGSWDFNDVGPDPRPLLEADTHGTRCCGEVAAGKNEACGIGIAYDANIAGIRILSKAISEADEALSLIYKMELNDIYSCSWGPPDNGMVISAPGMLVKKAILNGVQNGRDKRGSLYVFASGNGAIFEDNCNFDGYTNSIYSITVGAVDREGHHPYYSESCSANLVVTYSSNVQERIVTTDVHGGCTDQHGGTSAAAPIAAGIYALVLQARPELTWRDLQYLAVDTAVPVNVDQSGWQTTTIGKKFHHMYGYGKLDAYAIVERAKTWELVKPQAWFFAPEKPVNSHIEFSDDESGGIKSSVMVTAEDLKNANFERVEHVNVMLTVNQEHRGAIAVELISPDGIVSELAASRVRDKSNDAIVDWTFMSVVHWGESGVGEWTLHVYNDKVKDVSGELVDWTLKLWGETIDPSKAKLFSLDPQHEDEPIDRPEVSTSTSEAQPSSTAEPEQSSTAEPEQPSTTEASPAPTSASPTEGESKTTATATSTPSPTANPDAQKSIWSLIPTFGFSNRTALWIYGSLLLIIGFVGALTTYICISRRRARGAAFKRIPDLQSLEFDLIPSRGDDEDDGLFDLDSDDDGVDSPEGSEHEYRDDSDGGSDEDTAADVEPKAKRSIYDTYAGAKSDQQLFDVGSDTEGKKDGGASSSDSSRTPTEDTQVE